MRTYDFKNLSPLDFEELTRDLLQKKLGVYLESFTSGKDSGIDFRHTSDKNGEIIVQAKRYKAYQSLYNKLKNEESLKVQKLRPKKYILSTNVGRTPGNKKNMMNLFQGHLQKTEDIFGRDDLNNLWLLVKICG